MSRMAPTTARPQKGFFGLRPLLVATSTSELQPILLNFMLGAYLCGAPRFLQLDSHSQPIQVPP
jgi:hypothetical protein